jgi:carbonic anhydrase
MKNTIVSISLALVTSQIFTSCASSVVQTKASQAAISPAEALGELKAGNARFVAGQGRKRDALAQSKKTAAGQYPIAAILGCIDSRGSNEIIFDQGIGDIFSARVAGNILNDDLLGSLEFATAKAGAKVIFVVGHTRCGAVSGACQHVKLGHVTGLLEKIQPAVRKVSLSGHAGTHGPEFEDLVSAENVKQVVAQIRAQSSIIRDLEHQGKLVIAGGLYHLNTGKVEFFQ